MDLHHSQQSSDKSFYSPASPEVGSHFGEVLIENAAAADFGRRGRRIESKNPLPNSPRENLPILATSNDVREVVRFLKHKPEGLSLIEILDHEPRRVFDARKITAYEYWGVTERDDARIKLTALGNKLAGIVDLENEIFKEVLASAPVYLRAIEWISERALNIVTHYDITECWKQLPDNPQLSGAAEIVSFFSLCHAAELGVATVGKRGQPARLRIDLAKVREFLSGRKRRSDPAALNLFEAGRAGDFNRPLCRSQQPPSSLENIYVSTREVDEAAETLCEAIELADFQSVVSTVGSAAENDYLQSSKIEAMQSCQAGILILDETDCRTGAIGGETEIKDRRLMEISIATALFDRRVIIIWNSRLPVPEYLQNNLQIITDAGGQDFRTSFQAVKLLKRMNLRN